VFKVLSFLLLFLLPAGGFADEPPTATQASAAGIRHALLATGAETFVLSAEGKTVWTYPRSTRDGWVLEDGSILLAVNQCPEYPGGAAVLLNPDGKPIFSYTGTQNEVDTVQPLPGGHILVTESGKNPRLLELDRSGRTLVAFSLKCQLDNPHMQTRMARKLPNGHYLAPHLIDKVVREYNSKGEVVWEAQTPDWPFTAIRLQNGNTLIDCTRGNLAIEVDRKGKIVWQVTNADLEGAPIKDACGGQRLPNGNTVFTSYGQNDPNAIKLFEVTPDKKIVWSLKTGRAHGVHEFQILGENLRPLPGRQMR